MKQITNEQLTRELRAALRSESQYPISIEDVCRWLCYKTRQRLVYTLQAKFESNEHYVCITPDEDDVVIIDDLNATSRDHDNKQYRVTLECFESICKFRKGDRGREVRNMLMQCKIDDKVRPQTNVVNVNDNDSSSELEIVNSENEKRGKKRKLDGPLPIAKQQSRPAPTSIVTLLPLTPAAAAAPPTQAQAQAQQPVVRTIVCKNNVLKISLRRSQDTSAVPATTTIPIHENPTVQSRAPIVKSLSSSNLAPASLLDDSIKGPHQLHMDQIERNWMQQNEKIQRVIEQIDSPPFLTFWRISPQWDIAEMPQGWAIYSTMFPQSVGSDQEESGSAESSCDENEAVSNDVGRIDDSLSMYFN